MLIKFYWQIQTFRVKAPAIEAPFIILHFFATWNSQSYWSNSLSPNSNFPNESTLDFGRSNFLLASNSYWETRDSKRTLSSDLFTVSKLKNWAGIFTLNSFQQKRFLLAGSKIHTEREFMLFMIRASTIGLKTWE